MARVLQVRFDEDQVQLLRTLSIELLQALEALFDRLEQLQGSKPEPGDVYVPVRIDLQSMVAELEAMSPEQRQALADGCTPSSSLPRYRIHVPADTETSRDIDLLATSKSPSPKTASKSGSRSLAEKIAELQQILKVEP